MPRDEVLLARPETRMTKPESPNQARMTNDRMTKRRQQHAVPTINCPLSTVHYQLSTAKSPNDETRIPESSPNDE